MKYIYFGVGLGFDKDNKPVKVDEKLIEDVLFHATAVFGGVIAIRGTGAWFSHVDSKVITEPSLGLSIYSYASSSTIDMFAEYLKTAFNQKSILVAVNPAEVRFI